MYLFMYLFIYVFFFCLIAANFFNFFLDELKKKAKNSWNLWKRKKKRNAVKIWIFKAMCVGSWDKGFFVCLFVCLFVFFLFFALEGACILWIQKSPKWKATSWETPVLVQIFHWREYNFSVKLRILNGFIWGQFWFARNENVHVDIEGLWLMYKSLKYLPIEISFEFTIALLGICSL